MLVIFSAFITNFSQIVSGANFFVRAISSPFAYLYPLQDEGFSQRSPVTSVLPQLTQYRGIYVLWISNEMQQLIFLCLSVLNVFWINAQINTDMKCQHRWTSFVYIRVSENFRYKLLDNSRVCMRHRLLNKFLYIKFRSVEPKIACVMPVFCIAAACLPHNWYLLNASNIVTIVEV